MASASSSQSTFRMGRTKKSPTVMDQIGKFFAGEKKKKGKGSFRGALSSSPQRSAAPPKRRTEGNAVVHFLRTLVTPSTPKSKKSKKSQSSTKGQKGSADGQGTLTRLLKMGGSQSSPSTKR